LPGIDHVVVAFGSGATMVGLVASLGAERVIGIDTGAVADPGATLDELLDGMPGVPARRGDLRLDRGQVGAGYEALTPNAAAAMRLAARTEGIFLDPTYTARALAGLIACVADGRIGPRDRTVFVHTACSATLVSRNWPRPAATYKGSASVEGDGGRARLGRA
jgi:D-cysteine desulfhydrase